MTPVGHRGGDEGFMHFVQNIDTLHEPGDPFFIINIHMGSKSLAESQKFETSGFQNAQVTVFASFIPRSLIRFS